MGLPEIFPPIPEPPLVLVMLRGNFDLTAKVTGTARSRVASGEMNPRASFVAYVLDLRESTPVLLVSSPNGGLYSAGH